MTQPEVSRIVRKLRPNPAARERSRGEVLREYAAKIFDHDAIMPELTSWP